MVMLCVHGAGDLFVHDIGDDLRTFGADLFAANISVGCIVIGPTSY